LAFQYAVSLSLTVPENWSKHLSAGEDWFSGFMRRHHSEVSLRTPEATSLSRASSFNRVNVNLFLTILKVYTGDTTSAHSPSTILMKQVLQLFKILAKLLRLRALSRLVQ